MKKRHRVHCQCGEITGVRCEWTGAASKTVTVHWMPVHLRASHIAAGNSGVYPWNGAEELELNTECAERIKTDDPDWTELL